MMMEARSEEIEATSEEVAQRFVKPAAAHA
jgi:hypothetical protein